MARREKIIYILKPRSWEVEEIILPASLKLKKGDHVCRSGEFEKYRLWKKGGENYIHGVVIATENYKGD